MRFSELVDAVAQKHDEHPKKVRKIVDAFLEEATEAVKRGESVQLAGLGILKFARSERGVPRFVLNMADSLEQELRKGATLVEKYGVVIDKDKTVEAKLSGKCPQCGGPLTAEQIQEGKCPTCGTAPFEQKPEGNDAS